MWHYRGEDKTEVKRPKMREIYAAAVFTVLLIAHHDTCLTGPWIDSALDRE